METDAQNQSRILCTLLTAAESIRTGIAAVWVPPDRRYRMRLPETTFHPYHELFIQISGQNRFCFPDSQLDMLPGDIMLLPAELSHGEKNVDPHESCSHLVVMFQSGELTVHLGEAQPGQVPVPGFTLAYGHLRHPALLQIPGDLIACLRSEFGAPDALTTGLQLALLGYLIDQVRHGRPRQGTGHTKVQEAKRLVTMRLSYPGLCVQNLAGIIGCNPDYLSNLFRKETGETLSAYITRKRLAAACEYLTTTTMTVSEVAWACGFNDPSYFTYRFRQTNGTPPATYRSQRGVRVES